MTGSAFWLMNLKTSTAAVGATLGVPLAVTVGPALGVAVVAAFGVVCVAGFFSVTRRKAPGGTILIPPI
jgi:hypothetical protein